MSKQEISRTRLQGTRVTTTRDAMEQLAAIRRVLTDGYAKINGVMVDSFSASAIVQVYDALDEDNKEKFANLPVGRMADIAFKLINKQSGREE